MTLRTPKRLFPFLCALALAPCTVVPAAAQASATPAPRVRYSLDEGWSFLPRGENFAWIASTPDAAWERVNLPHTWNAEDPFDDAPSYRRGVGWYRRTLHLSDALAGQRVFLYFEGANQVADVYVNGAYVCEHRGGYTAFACDVTEQLRFEGEGNENLLAVKVDNSQNPFLPPLSVGYALYGGLYRDVWLVATEPIHFPVTDHASAGVFVSTPSVSREKGEVAVRGTVVNDATDAASLVVESTVRDAQGRVVSTKSRPLRVGAGAEGDFELSLPRVARPHLWSPADPYLYSVVTEVRAGERLLDRTEVPLGFRWFRFDPEKGFFLNGEKLQLKGTNRHQDYEGLGSALSNEQHVRDMELIKQMGANFVRLAHYPQDPAVLAAADRLGLLIWEEIPVVNYITVDERFTANAEEMLRDMIRQGYNHPSVILWGIMNEVFLWSPEGARIRVQNDTTYMRQVRDFAAKLNAVVHEEDPTRYTTMAIHGSNDYDKAGVAEITQVVGLNTYSGWYGGEFGGFGRGLDRRHARYPDQVIFISEYGAGSDERVNSTQPARFDFSNQWQQAFHESYLRQIEARPWLAGTAIWNEFDFSQPETGGSIPYENQKGMLTWDRHPKDTYFLYKANWNPAPMVHVASHDWTHRAGIGPAPVTQPVKVYSNLERVELFLNGRSLGTKSPDDVHAAVWQVPFTAGDNVVVARGERGGEEYSDRVTIHFRVVPADLRADTAFRALGVNVGSLAQVTDRTGEVWMGDQPYHAGSYGYVGGEAEMFNKDIPITGTSLEPLYFTYRQGLQAYRFDVPDGDYMVQLRFAEPTEDEPGARVFDVLVNGRRILEGVDLVARSGQARATDISIAARAEGGRGLTISFDPEKGAPVLNAIRVRKVDP